MAMRASRFLTVLVLVVLGFVPVGCAPEPASPGEAAATSGETGTPEELPAPTRVAEEERTKSPEGIPGETSLRSRVKRGVDKALSYLREEQAKDGTWQIEGKPNPGITALAASAFLTSPRKYTSGDGPFIRKPLEYVASLAREDGGLYDVGLANYVTCVAVQALVESGESRYEPLIRSAQGFLRILQADEGEGYEPGDRYYGGTGYGGDERPDLSNASLWFDAMKATDLPADDESYKKALVFLNRCQNRSESNREEWENPREGVVYVPGNDGGAMYAPGNSPAGYDSLGEGRKSPRSYGSMTYALLKCYLLAGLSKDDPRVESLVQWIGRNYTLEVNPGFLTEDDGMQGVYYYYLNMARSLEVWGEDEIVDADGVAHDWREELSEHLLSLQKKDGAWVNPNSRWWEGLPVLTTCYAALALNLCYKGLE